MTRKSQSRDNAYYLELLRVKHPSIYDDFTNGKFATLADARRAAGSLKPRSRLQELTNAWSKASPAERAEFQRIAGLGPTRAPPAVTAAPAVFSVKGKLEPWARALIVDILRKRGLIRNDIIQWGQVMKELGHSPHNPALSLALARETTIRDPKLLTDLQAWTEKHRAP
jgi:hypothetical protein